MDTIKSLVPSAGPQYLKGDKAAIDAFIDRFDVSSIIHTSN